MNIYRIPNQNLAILQQTIPTRHGTILLIPLDHLLALRSLVALVPPEAASDEDFKRIERAPWAASGSSFGIALMYEDPEQGEFTLFLESDEWEALQAALHIYDDLITIKAASDLTGKSIQALSQACQLGKLAYYADPAARQRQGRILVSRQEILAL
jgi:hypothetical protein